MIKFTLSGMSDNLNTHINRKNFIKYVISEMSDKLNTHTNRKNFTNSLFPKCLII